MKTRVLIGRIIVAFVLLTIITFIASACTPVPAGNTDIAPHQIGMLELLIAVGGAIAGISGTIWRYHKQEVRKTESEATNKAIAKVKYESFTEKTELRLKNLETNFVTLSRKIDELFAAIKEIREEERKTHEILNDISDKMGK